MSFESFFVVVFFRPFEWEIVKDRLNTIFFFTVLTQVFFFTVLTQVFFLPS